nr:lysine-rich arabinogalactan protein 19-like [Aegilops tauschii subsp. strangulata]
MPRPCCLPAVIPTSARRTVPPTTDPVVEPLPVTASHRPCSAAALLRPRSRLAPPPARRRGPLSAAAVPPRPLLPPTAPSSTGPPCYSAAPHRHSPVAARASPLPRWVPCPAAP